MMKITNPKAVREMDILARRFIGEAVSMFNFNNLREYDMDIVPKTKKSFRMNILDSSGTIVSTEEFSAANLKSANGTFKVARLINWIHLINM